MGMSEATHEYLKVRRCPQLDGATLILSLTGWMDGGDVSTGTVKRLVELLGAEPFAEIDPEPFYIFNVPGPMDVAALFRPHIEIEDGLIKSIDMPSGVFYCHEQGKLLLFVGREPNLRWRAFGDCIFALAHSVGVRRILFVGSFGGAVPHTREPRLYFSCSDEQLRGEMQQYGVRRGGYEGPGSFVSYLTTRAPAAAIEMISLVTEIPGYLQGPNPMCIEAVSRRLAKILKLPLDLDSLRAASTEWELHVSSIVEKNDDIAETVRKLEERYDNELLENAVDET
jgi:proteasome assembly chaperone (PAC2) family protein